MDDLGTPLTSLAIMARAASISESLGEEGSMGAPGAEEMMNCDSVRAYASSDASKKAILYLTDPKELSMPVSNAHSSPEREGAVPRRLVTRATLPSIAL